MPEGAAAAEWFAESSLGKTATDGGGSGAGADLGKGLAVDIAQGDISLGIETAGDHGAVNQDGNMVPKPPAGALVAQIWGRGMGPGETGVLTQENPGGQSEAVARGWHGVKGLGEGEKIRDPLEDSLILVALFCRGEIPESQADEDGGAHGFPDKGENPIQGGFLLWTLGQFGKTVQGNIDLTQCRTGQQKPLPLGQQDAVGGQVDLEAVLLTEGEYFSKLRVQQGFAQHMQGKMIGMILDFA